MKSWLKPRTGDRRTPPCLRIFFLKMTSPMVCVIGYSRSDFPETGRSGVAIWWVRAGLPACLPAARLCPLLLGGFCLAALLCVWVCAVCAVRAVLRSFFFPCRFLDSTREPMRELFVCSLSNSWLSYIFVASVGLACQWVDLEQVLRHPAWRWVFFLGCFLGTLCS